MQWDGNLVVLCHGAQTWESGTSDVDIKGGVAIQSDGNLVLYKQSGGYVWKTSTSGRTGGTVLVVQDDGNVVAKDRTSGAEVWSTETACYRKISPGKMQF